MTDPTERRRAHADTEQMLEWQEIAKWARWPSGRVSVRMASGELIEV